MNATTTLTTTTLLRKLHRIDELLAAFEQNPNRRTSAMDDVADEVMSYIGLEELVLLPIAEPAIGAAARVLRTTHVRARLALFRMATSDATDEAFVRSARALRQTFAAHAFALANVRRALERALPAARLSALVEALERAAHARVDEAPSLTKDQGPARSATSPDGDRVATARPKSTGGACIRVA